MWTMIDMNLFVEAGPSRKRTLTLIPTVFSENSRTISGNENVLRRASVDYNKYLRFCRK